MRGALLVTLAGCSQLFGLESPRQVDASADISADAPLGPWIVQPGVIAMGEQPTATADLREIYFVVGGRIHLLVDGMDKGPVTDLAGTLGLDYNPEVSADGLTLYFSTDRDEPSVDFDVWASTRPTRQSAWAKPVIDDGLNSATRSDFPGCISEDGRVMATTGGTNQFELYEHLRSSIAGRFAEHRELTELNHPQRADFGPCVSADGHTLYLSSDRDGPFDIYVAQRAALTDPFSAPVRLADFNLPGKRDPWVSPDGRTMLFVATGNMNQPEIHRATR